MTDLAVSDMMLRNAGVGGIQSAGVRICFNGLIALSLPFVEPCSVVLSRKKIRSIAFLKISSYIRGTNICMNKHI